MLLQILEKLYNQQSVSMDESKLVFDLLIQDKLDPILLTSFITSLKIKGEAPQEIAGAAVSLLNNAKPFPSTNKDFADIVGTGGDNSHTINISTISAIVSASMGYAVAKHGNRSISSKSGSADLLEQLNIDINSSPDKSAQSLNQLNFCFLLAPNYHTGFKYAANVRKTLKTRTLFNILGPLINPAKPKKILLGVYSPDLINPIIETLKLLKYEHAIVVHGDGLDEVAIHGKTIFAELKKGQITYSEITPDSFGLQKYALTELIGDTPEYNAKDAIKLLQGFGSNAKKSAISANVALFMTLFGKSNIKENAQTVMQILNTDQSYKFLEQLVGFYATK